MGIGDRVAHWITREGSDRPRYMRTSPFLMVKRTSSYRRLIVDRAGTLLADRTVSLPRKLTFERQSTRPDPFSARSMKAENSAGQSHDRQGADGNHPCEKYPLATARGSVRDGCRSIFMSLGAPQAMDYCLLVDRHDRPRRIGIELRGIHGLQRCRSDSELTGHIGPQPILKCVLAAGSHSKKKLVPESRVSWYTRFPDPTCSATRRSRARARRRAVLEVDVFRCVLDRIESWTSTSSPGRIASPSAMGLNTNSRPLCSRLKYFRATEKKSPCPVSGSLSVEKCQVAEAKTNPLLSFSTVIVACSGPIFSPRSRSDFSCLCTCRVQRRIGPSVRRCAPLHLHARPMSLRSSGSGRASRSFRRRPG